MSTKEYLPHNGRNWRNEVEDVTQYLNYKGSGPGIVSEGADGGPLYELIGQQVSEASRRASAKWHGLLESEEIESEIWIQIMESPATANDLRDKDHTLVFDLLCRYADRICIGERDDYEHFTGNFRYSVNEAKVLVEEYFLRNEEEFMVDLVDVEIALDQLLEINQRQYEAIFRRYALGETPGSDKSFKNALSRGLTHLTDLMNRNYKERERDYHDGPGTRNRVPKNYDPYEGDWDNIN